MTGAGGSPAPAEFHSPTFVSETALFDLRALRFLRRAMLGPLRGRDEGHRDSSLCGAAWVSVTGLCLGRGDQAPAVGVPGAGTARQGDSGRLAQAFPWSGSQERLVQS